MRDAVCTLGIEIRVGLHTGEVETVGEGLAGIAVHTGARVAAAAQPSEVLVCRTVADLVAGSGIRSGTGEPTCSKGVRGDWQLYAVEQMTGAARWLMRGGEPGRRR